MPRSRPFRRLANTLSSLFLLFIAGSPPAAAVPLFSIDVASPSIPGPGITESDVFIGPGPVGGPPVLAVPAGGLGLVGMGFDDLNAMATGSPGFAGMVHFGVDRASLGAGTIVAPDVTSEAAVGQQAGDIYVSGNVTAAVRLPMHNLAYNQDILGEIPALPPGAAAAPPLDDLDALHIDPTLTVPAVFSMTVGHPYLGASGAIGCGGDLFGPVGGGPPAPLAPFAAIGLAACADDVDALEFDPLTGDVWFSLAPGSPSLGPGSPIGGCGLGCSPADLFSAPGLGGAAFLLAPAAALGLAPADNLNSLALNPCATATGADSDGDGVDDGCDNCILAANPSQFDGNLDGFGNACDADLDGSLVVGIGDFVMFSPFFGAGFGPGYPAALDFDESGAVGISDFVLFVTTFGLPPGPSGLACAGTIPCTHAP